MFCPKCGAQVDQGSNYCQKCGAAVTQPTDAAALPQQPAPVLVSVAKTSSMAIASLVLGIVGFFFLPLIASVLAIVFGAIGMGQINRSNEAIKGKGMATAGIILGVIGIVVMILVIALVGFSMTWITELSNSMY